MQSDSFARLKTSHSATWLSISARVKQISQPKIRAICDAQKITTIPKMEVIPFLRLK